MSERLSLYVTRLCIARRHSPSLQVASQQLYPQFRKCRCSNMLRTSSKRAALLISTRSLFSLNIFFPCVHVTFGDCFLLEIIPLGIAGPRTQFRSWSPRSTINIHAQFPVVFQESPP